LAQESAVIRAVATVLPSMTVVGTNNLNFEYVFPDVRKSVEKTAVGYAGEWTISGSPSAEVTLQFTLPDSLQAVHGNAAMRIGFSIADAAYDDGTGAGQSAPSGVINPYAVNTKNLSWLGTMVVWLGGTVYPSRSQTGGTYTGDITLTVTYTGN
jgi:hypothetical protein